jgi:hypothetical protein
MDTTFSIDKGVMLVRIGLGLRVEIPFRSNNSNFQKYVGETDFETPRVQKTKHTHLYIPYISLTEQNTIVALLGWFEQKTVIDRLLGKMSNML